MAQCHACQREIDPYTATCPHCDASQDVTLFARLPQQGPGGAGGGEARAPVLASSEPAAGREVHACFLVSPSLKEPYELERGELVRIGRSRNNEICLPSGHVSRLHAELVYEDGGWVVGDLGSKNGTYVNGERVFRHPLRHGDRIRIGHFELQYLELTREQTRELLMGKGALAGGETARLETEAGFAGDLAKIQIVEVVQLLHKNRKTGCLSVWAAGGQVEAGRLYFLDGRIVHAERDGEEGMQAVRPLLRTREGSFRFRPQHAIEKKTISIPTDKLLFEALAP
ncbi:MAG: hypothetical protein KatS3mg102_2194 [Planctomycetota bacterium]|nr:MAG: hypothetical protein KatS3mg102_2194 [Planctomycetota bacterium]